ncbi:MAG: glutamate formimidoyltransferase [Anaerolineales bacterium]|nr:glutamate formimidoyltransferase [Anaerolineales bacterium]
MPETLVECVPNFAEGRRPEVVAQIVEAVKRTPEVILLDHSSDPDHNRSVLTYVGSIEGVEQAAFAAIAKAAELIDMDEQEGEHPRIGATDVVPFIPISGATMADCVAIAQRLGKRVGEELNIPVYLYEQAATRPERENLATLRKGEYEGLKAEIGSNPDRQPDFGPSEMGKAGATVIGARAFLVAYNVYLDTEDVDVAKKIGKAIRHSSGGMRYVKGLGMLVDGKAQVSMNLTNFRHTPVFRVVEMIRREAARYGANITHSELIGLIPQQALIDAAVWYLQLDGFCDDQILEYKMNAELAARQGKTVEAVGFLDQLAADTPTPGGGSAAAYSGAMAASLVVMVARLTLGKKKYEDFNAQMEEIIIQAELLKEKLAQAVIQDAEAFESVMTAYRMPKDSESQKSVRAEAIREATLQAARVPLEVAGDAVGVLGLAQQVAENGNLNAVTDAGSAAALARAALTGAGMNVRINLSGLAEHPPAAEMIARLNQFQQMADKYLAAIEEAVASRANLLGINL